MICVEVGQDPGAIATQSFTAASKSINHNVGAWQSAPSWPPAAEARQAAQWLLTSIEGM